MLDRYLLRYFLAVVDQGTFSRGAVACNVSQPTLSVGIAKLERIIGQQLFIRSNQRIELTEAGSRLLVHARRVEREFNVLLQSMDVAAGVPRFRLGVLGSVPGRLIADSVRQTRPTQTRRFELVIGSERELAGHLAKGRIDIALTLVGRGADRFAERRLVTEGYALAMSIDHPLAGQQGIAAEALANEVMIVRRHCEALSDTSRFFTERGVRPHFALRSTSDERVIQMVAAGLGVTVMPRCFRDEALVRPALIGFNQTRSLGWAASSGAEGLLSDPTPLMQDIDRRLSAACT